MKLGCGAVLLLWAGSECINNEIAEKDVWNVRNTEYESQPLPILHLQQILNCFFLKYIFFCRTKRSLSSCAWATSSCCC